MHPALGDIKILKFDVDQNLELIQLCSIAYESFARFTAIMNLNRAGNFFNFTFFMIVKFRVKHCCPGSSM
jgi:hypothetical protein